MYLQTAHKLAAILRLLFCLNRFTQHPEKSEAMLICKTRVMGPSA